MDKDAKMMAMFASKELPALPQFFIEFNQAIKKPNASVREVAEVVRKDQALVSRILRLANSALYSNLSKISGIPQAINFLGLEMLRNIVLQIALVKTFNFSSNHFPEFDSRVFWEHSIATAFFADLLAKKLHFPPDENYYLGGLLHDIGKLIVFQYYPTRFEQIVMKVVMEEIPFLKGEETVIGVNHSEIGGYLTRRWRFSRELSRAVELHHSNAFSEFENLDYVVFLANLFAHKALLALPWENVEPNLSESRIWDYLRLKPGETVKEFLLEIVEETEKVREAVRLLLEVARG